MADETIILTGQQGEVASKDPWRYVYSAEGGAEITLDGAFTVEDLMQIIVKKVGNREKVVELCERLSEDSREK